MKTTTTTPVAKIRDFRPQKKNCLAYEKKNRQVWQSS